MEKGIGRHWGTFDVCELAIVFMAHGNRIGTCRNIADLCYSLTILCGALLSHIDGVVNKRP
eukprot:10762018-Alexandrium_andersonii.AAC.1